MCSSKFVLETVASSTVVSTDREREREKGRAENMSLNKVPKRNIYLFWEEMNLG